MTINEDFERDFLKDKMYLFENQYEEEQELLHEEPEATLRLLDDEEEESTPKIKQDETNCPTLPF